MYLLARLILQFACMIGMFFLAIVGLIYWPFGLAVLGLIAYSKSKQRKLTTLGSARWADENDLEKAGMLYGSFGLNLGRFYVGRNMLRSVEKLFSNRLSSAQACREFCGSLRYGHHVSVRLPQAIHTAVFSPSGQGKGVSAVIPFLLETDASCVVIDFKGENALLTADHRRNVFGHQCIIIDPFKKVSDAPDSFNPLDFIDAEDPLALDACQDLAKALVIRPSEEREPHFNDAAEMWIAGVIAVVVCYGNREGSRSLQTVREFLSDPRKLEKALLLMQESDAWGGMLARMGGQLMHFVDKEKSSTLTTVSRHLRFLDTLAISANTHRSSFDPSHLRSGKLTIYLVLPPEHMRSQSPLLRLWIGSLLRSVVETGLDEKNKVHFVIDEAASLGHLEQIDDAVDKFRGYGIRLFFCFQSLGQLKTCFPNGQEQTLLSNTSQIFFAVNDTQSAEMISSRLGESTIIVDGGGSGHGKSRQTGGGSPMSGPTYSYNSNQSWTQQARRLLKPEEVIAIDPRIAITFTPGVLPVCTRLSRYYEEPRLGKPSGTISRLLSGASILLLAIVFLSLSLAFATSVMLLASPTILRPAFRAAVFPQ